MFIAAAAMAFSACNVEPIEAPEEATGTHEVTFVASQVETKTTMDIQNGIASFDWEEADVNYFHIFENEYSYKAKDTEGTIDDNGLMQITATFENGGTTPFTYFGFFAPTFFTYPQVPAAQTGLFENGSLKGHVVFMYNGERIDAEDASEITVEDGDEIVLYPPVSGG